MSVIVLICLADVGVRSRGIRSSASYGGWLRSAESTADLWRGGHTKARFRGSYATPAGKALPGKVASRRRKDRRPQCPLSIYRIFMSWSIHRYVVHRGTPAQRVQPIP
jgi:hypothetical protein